MIEKRLKSGGYTITLQSPEPCSKCGNLTIYFDEKQIRESKVPDVLCLSCQGITDRVDETFKQ
jgi:hypothetical protein